MADSEDQRISASQLLSFGNSIIRVTAKKNKVERQFNIHEQLLEGRSSVVRDALRPRSGQSKKQTFTLYGCDPDNFEIYRQYIYTDKIPCRKKPGNQNDVDAEWESLVNLWLVSKKLNDPEAMDAACNALLHLFRQEHSGIPPVSLLLTVYRETKAESSLRRLMVDMYCWGGTAALVVNAELPYPFYVDLCAALLREKEINDNLVSIPPGVSCCEYHVHETGIECSSRKRKHDESSGEVGEVEERDKGAGRNPGLVATADLQQQLDSMQATLNGLVKKEISQTIPKSKRIAVVDLDESESEGEASSPSISGLFQAG